MLVKNLGYKFQKNSPQMNLIYLRVIFYLFVLLARFPRGQLQPVVFILSCSLRSLTNNTS
ncbi:hypothetical protein BUZ13_09730 [Staphylococcus gallinarum]|nr:hypothetical protein BUZ13_09730 [Staphylococcus gallinarum]PTK93522.1 hypothetical protein BUZ05_07090 [Staphylococcus gallinarum]